MSNHSHRRPTPQPTGHTDPRQLGGDIVGPGGPHDRDSVLVDATNALLADEVHVALVNDPIPGYVGEVIYMLLEGRVNNTHDRARIGFMFNVDGAAALISQLLALASRVGPKMLSTLVYRLVELDLTGKGSTVHLRAALDLAEAVSGDAKTEDVG